MLTGLQYLLRNHGHNTGPWDPAFSIVFLCLIVIGSIQWALVERAITEKENGDFPYTNEDAMGISMKWIRSSPCP